MSSEDWLDNEPTINSKKKSKAGAAAHLADDPIDQTFDNMLESAAKSSNIPSSSKGKSNRRTVVNDAASGWSNENAEESGGQDIGGMPVPPVPMIRQSNRRAAEEIVAADIPTIPMDDADNDDAIDLAPQVAVAPEFSIHQIASFKEIENDFCRERASQYIDSKIDIGILYNNLNLHEEFDAEEQKLWDWDKVFVEIRNSIPNPISKP